MHSPETCRPDDLGPNRNAATDCGGELLAGRVTFIATSVVISEMHALVVRERGARAGCDLLDAVYSDPH